MSRPTWDTSRLLQDFAYRTITCYGRTFQTVLLSIQMPRRGPATPLRMRSGLGSSTFARRYLWNHYCFLFLRVLRCFTSPGSRYGPIEFRLQHPDITRDGLPHSEIPGSKRACRSPGLIAAYYVLHRLLMPRHPSCALIRLTKKSWSSRHKKLLARLYAIVKEQQSSAIAGLRSSNGSPSSIRDLQPQINQVAPAVHRTGPDAGRCPSIHCA